ncbi:MAG: mandelate racemase/muconate lactonizing enzyme family protein [Planctomycetota bacterium]|jgi:L-alanine-DL-glutamate epimerase-like enolase superfamily enzyme
MKITALTVFLLKPTVLVKLETDAGIDGWGEASPMNGEVVAAHIRHSLADLVVGEDPFDVERLVEKMFVRTYKIAGQAQAMAASGIEIACRDISGKALGVPVYKLLGGAYRRKIPMYASSMRRDISPDDEAERLARLVDEKGFKAVKVRVGSTYGFDVDAVPGRSVEVVRRVRERLGEDIAIMVDGNSCFTAPRAIELGRRLEQFNIFHFEEPCPYTNLDATAKVAAALDVPVAGGEQDWDIVRFREMLERGAVDIVQPDLIKAGGFTVCAKVAALAEAFGAVCTPHQTQPLGTIANLHFAAAAPSVRYFQEYNIEPHPVGESIFRNPVPVIDGSMEVPEGPGLGVDIDEKTVERLAE